MQELTRMTAAEAVRMLRKGAVSSEELTQACLSRVEALDAGINSFITVQRESALARARKIDSGGDYSSPLCGVPVALKDVFCTKGTLTSAASGLMKDHIPGHDSTVAGRLARAGAVILGKTNMHEWASGCTGDVSYYGAVKNPWNLNKMTGGSSSGSAAAVASGMAFAAMGSDTGGSIRVPAAFCGVVGFKPTYGMVSLYGVVPLAFSMDHPGPLARSVEDVAIIMDAITGYDPKDVCLTRYRGEPTRYCEVLAGVDDLKGRRIGIPENFFFECTDYEVEKITRQAFKALEELGAQLVPVTVDMMDNVISCSSVIMETEMAWYHREMAAKHPDGYMPDVLDRIRKGQEHTGIAYIDAVKEKDRISGEWEGFMRRHRLDAVATPSSPVAAGDQKAETVVTRGREENVRAMNIRHTRLSNITGGPAVSVPCGFTAEKLPLGLQLMGKTGDDATVLKLAWAYEKHNPYTLCY